MQSMPAYCCFYHSTSFVISPFSCVTPLNVSPKVPRGSKAEPDGRWMGLDSFGSGDPAERNVSADRLMQNLTKRGGGGSSRRAKPRREGESEREREMGDGTGEIKSNV